MIERVARAMMAVDYPEDIGGDLEGMWWDRRGDAYLAYARAAIEAMREPSEAMIIHGCGAFDFDDSLSDDAERFNTARCGYIFTAMIDAALEEGK